MDLTTLSSLRACRTLKTVVKRKFFTWPSDPFVISDVSDAQNCGKMRILAPARATLSSLSACRTLQTVVKRKFFPKAAAKGSFKKSAVIKHCYQTLPKVLLK